MQRIMPLVTETFIGNNAAKIRFILAMEYRRLYYAYSTHSGSIHIIYLSGNYNSWDGLFIIRSQ